MTTVAELEAEIARLDARFRFWARVRRAGQRMCGRTLQRLEQTILERNRIAPVEGAKGRQ